MKILQAHNFYQIKGGEDTVVAAERKLLEDRGHTVIPFYKKNEEINQWSTYKKAKLIFTTTWSDVSYNKILAVLKLEKPDVVHVHNFLPLISPAVFYACHKAKIPVVLTLHNYRLICTNGIFMRDGKICEDCLGHSAKGAIAKKCYRDSKLQTYSVARMLDDHTAKKTWTTKINAFLCLTEFAREKFIQHGLPAEKLVVKPNFIASRFVEAIENPSPYFLFVGRLTASKGVELLKEIAPQLSIPIKLIGEGDLTEELSDIENLELLGIKSNEETLAYIQGAKALILPSRWYEGMPMTILEAFSLKTPVVTSNLGAMKSMIQNRINGFLIDPFSAEELRMVLTYILNEESAVLELVNRAFEEYQAKYAPESNYEKLISIYTSVIENSKV